MYTCKVSTIITEPKDTMSLLNPAFYSPHSSKAFSCHCHGLSDVFHMTDDEATLNFHWSLPVFCLSCSRRPFLQVPTGDFFFR